ncbi:hypothetical protein MPER_11370 [Moniliophthora perniciosa FA553]|nr:hypothetical protein MPER_11370 [Moniliophthora perniciosa FA553]
MPPPMPSLLQALRLWAGKPIRWVPPLLSLILIFWLFGPKTSVWPKRADQVRTAFIHAFNGWGVTLYDALDTMWIMGLDDYFNEALEIVAQADFMISPVSHASEIVRYLGGLLSAYSLSGKSVLLEKADELGGLLLPAFNTKSGFPMFSVNPQNKRVKGSWASGTTLWSEAMTCQMEYNILHISLNRDMSTR